MHGDEVPDTVSFDTGRRLRGEGLGVLNFVLACAERWTGGRVMWDEGVSKHLPGDDVFALVFRLTLAAPAYPHDRSALTVAAGACVAAGVTCDVI